MECALSLIAKSRPIKQVSRLLRLARSNLVRKTHRPADWKDRRFKGNSEKAVRKDLQQIAELQKHLVEFPSVGYRRLTALERRRRQSEGLPPINHKCVFRLVHEYGLTLNRKPKMPGRSKEHDGHVGVSASDIRWCSDGLEFKCLNGESVTVTFVLDCCDRECISLVARSGKGLTARMVQDALLMAVERRFASITACHGRTQFLTDNGSAYIAHSTRELARKLGLDCRRTAVCSPQSNGIAEAFVRILKRDYLPFIDLTCAHSAMAALSEVLRRYNTKHPHSALGYLSPQEFRAAQGCISIPVPELQLKQEPVPPRSRITGLLKKVSGDFLNPRFGCVT